MNLFFIKKTLASCPFSAPPPPPRRPFLVESEHQYDGQEGSSHFGDHELTRGDRRCAITELLNRGQKLPVLRSSFSLARSPQQCS